MGKPKQYLLTQQQFDELNQSALWQKVELTLEAIINTPGIQRKDALLGIYGSGDATATKNLNGRIAIFGMDVIVYEKKPKFSQGEWYVNVYHYIVTMTKDPTLPYCLEGPFTKETLMGHWPQSLELGHYSPDAFEDPPDFYGGSQFDKWT